MRTVLYTGIHQKNNGIIAWEYNWENKLFSILFEKSEVQNITYLCKSTDAPYLFAAGEYDGQGMIAVYRIISEGELQFLTSYIYKKEHSVIYRAVKMEGFYLQVVMEREKY